MTKPRIAAIVAAATLGAAAFTGAAVALAADGTPTQSPSASDMRGGQGERGHGPGERGPREGAPGHMLHSEGVIEDADGNFVTVRMQTGEVTAISATSISVKSVDGYTSTYAINDATEQERDRTADTQAKVGDTVHVRATVDGSTATADDIHAMSADFAAQMEEERAEMGGPGRGGPGRGGPGRGGPGHGGPGHGGPGHDDAEDASAA